MRVQYMDGKGERSGKGGGLMERRQESSKCANPRDERVEGEEGGRRVCHNCETTTAVR